jgi:hypothetical protein
MVPWSAQVAKGAFCLLNGESSETCSCRCRVLLRSYAPRQFNNWPPLAPGLRLAIPLTSGTDSPIEKGNQRPTSIPSAMPKAGAGVPDHDNDVFHLSVIIRGLKGRGRKTFPKWRRLYLTQRAPNDAGVDCSTDMRRRGTTQVRTGCCRTVQQAPRGIR